jgi:hypothetical protein
MTFDPTEKQAEILRIVFNTADEGRFVSLEELRAKLSYGSKVSQSAVNCSVRFLVIREMVEMVYGSHYGPFVQGRKGYVKPTPAAYRRFKPPQQALEI